MYIRMFEINSGLISTHRSKQYVVASQLGPCVRFV